MAEEDTVKREAQLKSLFGRELARQFPGFQTLQYATNGAPDRSIVGYGHQSNWEMKHATPDFDSPADQELVCAQLAAAGHCRYVIWFEHRGIEKTLIVHPKHVMRRPPGPTSRHTAVDLLTEVWCVGFDMRWLVEQVWRVHRA